MDIGGREWGHPIAFLSRINLIKIYYYDFNKLKESCFKYILLPFGTLVVFGESLAANELSLNRYGYPVS
jgi:hypothetical protein